MSMQCDDVLGRTYFSIPTPSNAMYPLPHCWDSSNIYTSHEGRGLGMELCFTLHGCMVLLAPNVLLCAAPFCAWLIDVVCNVDAERKPDPELNAAVFFIGLCGSSIASAF